MIGPLRSDIRWTFNPRVCDPALMTSTNDTQLGWSDIRRLSRRNFNALLRPCANLRWGRVKTEDIIWSFRRKAMQWSTTEVETNVHDESSGRRTGALSFVRDREDMGKIWGISGQKSTYYPLLPQELSKDSPSPQYIGIYPNYFPKNCQYIGIFPLCSPLQNQHFIHKSRLCQWILEQKIQTLQIWKMIINILSTFSPHSSQPLT